MKKIKCIFERIEGRAINVPNSDADVQWVFDGEGVATRKWDGTCCLILNGKLYRRLQVKPGGTYRPYDWIHHSFDPNEESGKGWVPVKPPYIKRADELHYLTHMRQFGTSDGRGNYAMRLGSTENDGTWELCGPKVGGNPERLTEHKYFRHGADHLPKCPRDYSGIREYFLATPYMEGVVFHHPDGRMAKITLRDYGIRREPFPT